MAHLDTAPLAPVSVVEPPPAADPAHLQPGEPTPPPAPVAENVTVAAVEPDPKKLSGEGLKSVFNVEGVPIKPELRKIYEDLLQSTARRLEAYQQKSGNKLTKMQEDFLAVYKEYEMKKPKDGENAERFLDTDSRWALAHTVLEAERYMLSAMIGKDIVGVRYKEAEQDKDRHKIVLQEAKTKEGAIRKLWNNEKKDFTKEGSLAQTWEYWFGAPKIEMSGIEFNFQDFSIDTSMLSQEYQDYIAYWKRGMNEEQVMNFLKLAQKGRNDLYQSLGARPDDLWVASPWQQLEGRLRSMPSTATQTERQNAVMQYANELYSTDWSQDRMEKLDRIRKKGKLADGTLIDWNRQDHINAAFFEAETATVQTYLTLEVQAIAAHQGNRKDAVASMEQRVKTLENPDEAKKEHEKKIVALRKEIANLKGKPETADTPAVEGELKKLEAQLAKLDEEQKVKESEKKAKEDEKTALKGDDLVQAREEKRSAYDAAVDKVNEVKSVIRQKKREITRLEKSVPRVEKYYKDHITKVVNTKDYQDGLVFAKQYAAVERKEANLNALITSAMEREKARLGRTDLTKAQKDTVKAGFTASIVAIQAEYDAIINQINTEPVLWEKYQRSLEVINRLKNEREEQLKQNKEVKARLIGEVETHNTELASKEIDRDQAKRNFNQAELRVTKNEAEKTRIDTDIAGIEAEITAKKVDIDAKKLEIETKKTEIETKERELVDLLEIDPTEHKPGDEEKIARLKMVIELLGSRYTEMLANLQWNAADMKLKVQDITLIDVAPGRTRRDYTMGYMYVLDKLFPHSHLMEGDKAKKLKIAMDLLTPKQMAQSLYETLNDQLGYDLAGVTITRPIGSTLPPHPQPDDIVDVFQAIEERRVNQIDFASAFVPIMYRIQQNGLKE